MGKGIEPFVAMARQRLGMGIQAILPDRLRWVWRGEDYVGTISDEQAIPEQPPGVISTDVRPLLNIVVGQERDGSIAILKRFAGIEDVTHYYGVAEAAQAIEETMRFFWEGISLE